MQFDEDHDLDKSTTNKRKLPQKLLLHSASRSDKLVKSIEDAMRVIGEEIEQNDGIYPHGRVSAEEVCRRAGTKGSVLQQKHYKETLRKKVAAWLQQIKSGSITGYRAVRRAVTDRAIDLKNAHDAVADAYYIEQQLHNASKLRIRELEAEVAALKDLLAQSSNSKITFLPAPDRNNRS